MNNILQLLVISDTHGLHNQIKIPDGLDFLIHCGDEANSRDPIQNFKETLDFFEWYEWAAKKVTHTIFVSGNHSTAIYNNLLLGSDIEAMGIHYLNHEAREIGGIKFFGSPTTPTYGSWAFMRKRHKMADIWEAIPEDIEWLITHGPCKGILDLAEDAEDRSKIAQVGCKSLANKIKTLKNLKVHSFGHLHQTICKAGIFNNSGVFIGSDGIYRINAATVAHKPEIKLVNQGFIVTYDLAAKEVINVRPNKG